MLHADWMIHAQIKKKLSQNDYHFPLREDKPSLSSLVLHSSQLSPSQHAFALLFLHETSTQHARKYYPRESRHVLKISLEGLRWVEGLYGELILLAPLKGQKDPPERKQRSFSLTQKDPSKRFHKDMIKIISLKYLWKFIPNTTWHSLDHDVTKPVFPNGARLLNFSLKILAIKSSAKLSGLSISLARWIKAFLLRVIKVFYKPRDLFFFISQSLQHLGIYAGLFQNVQAMGKTLVPRNICCSFISFPPF